MANRTFQAVVVVFWLSTMSWLVVSKVLPTLLLGEPPLLRKPSPGEDVIVCWQLRCNDKPVGWAASRTMTKSEGQSELRSRVSIDELSWADMAPAVMRLLVPRNVRTISLQATSRLQYDAQEQLRSFDSRVRFANADAVHVHGIVDEGTLRMQVQIGGGEPKHSSVEASAVLGSEFSPQPDMLGLRLGQTWTIPVCSPFPHAETPIEILRAEVEEETFLEWAGDALPVKVVVYRRDVGAGVSKDDSARARLWVGNDGRVLQQEMVILNGRLLFVRMSETQGERYAAFLREDWDANPERMRAGRHELYRGHGMHDNTAHQTPGEQSPGGSNDTDAENTNVAEAANQANAERGPQSPDESVKKTDQE